MNITRGKVEKAQKVVVYGTEGIGKTTFASKFPDVLFIDTEDSTTHLDVARLDKPTSMEMFVRQLKWVKDNKPCKTLAIDTVDWAESLVKTHIISAHGVDSIEKIEGGYGKGYTVLEEQFGKLLNLLNEIVDAGIHVVLLCHAHVKRKEEPTEIGSYDRWELKLEKKVGAKVKEWSDALLFANYDIVVVNIDNKGAAKGKNKAQGGERKMYVETHPAYDAKNRFGLIGIHPFDFSVIAPFISTTLGSRSTTAPMNTTGVPTQTQPTENVIQETPVQEVETPHVPELQSVQHVSGYDVNNNDWTGVPGELKDLMVMDEIYVDEVINIVASKGFYPAGTPISTYDTEFINGMIIAHWDGFKLAIEKERLPF